MQRVRRRKCSRRALRQLEKTNDAQQAAVTGLACPFCREPISWEPLSLLAGGAKALGGRDFDTARYVRQLEMRAAKNDPKACYKLGTHYYNNKDQADGNLKAMQYHLRAVELGSAESCKYVANCYLGRGIMGSNTERMLFFMRAGAWRGCIVSRSQIGRLEYLSGNRSTTMPMVRCPESSSLRKKNSMQSTVPATTLKRT